MGEELQRLMVLAQGGDRSAYETLLKELAATVKTMARHQLPPDRVDDGVQNVLIAVHKARHTYDPSRPFLPWFRAIARHRLTDTFRRVSRSTRRESARADISEVADPHDRVNANHDRAAVRAAVAELPEGQRRVVELLKLEQRSVREVAEILGMSESAVKVAAHRGYKRLREKLGGHDG